MPGTGTQNMLEQATDLFAQRVQDYAKGMAQHIGGPLSGHDLTQDEAVQRWNFTPLGSTQLADQHYYDLLQQGAQPGQALDQVYPMRKQLLNGPDLSSIIDKAKQIADWSAQATGIPQPPAYQGNTMPLLHLQQQPPPAPPAPAAPMPQPAAGTPMMGPPGIPGPPPSGMPVSPPPSAPVSAVPPPPGALPPAPPNPITLPPPATTAPPNANAPLGGGMLPPGQGPTGTLQA